MTYAATFASHLPYMRRFARALTGGQAAGDGLAMRALEDHGADAVAGEVPARVALYRALVRHWEAGAWEAVAWEAGAPGSLQPAATGIQGAADRSLDALTPLPRVAFLLHASEGFSHAEIAAVLRTTAAKVAELLDQAGLEIAEHISTAVLIIEDDPIIAMDLESVVLDLGHSVTQIARTRTEAVAAIAAQVPGLVLADIHLADGSSGLDAVQDILALCEVPVIFITAYPERLLTGARPEPTFLITKPFRTEMVRAIISQALFFDRKSSLVS
jgi:CheY-like chemotaxis protein/DNA-directed RNA polymerase specialized sigma24 family protein